MHHEPDSKPDAGEQLQPPAHSGNAMRQPDSNTELAEVTLADNPEQVEEQRLKAYAHLLDSAIRLPGGFRIGLDGIVGLVPGVGDLLGAGLSGYLIYGASRLDIPKSVIARMIINTALETVIGAIPIIGDAFDFVFKANERNARLLHAALDARNAKRGVMSEK